MEKYPSAARSLFLSCFLIGTLLFSLRPLVKLYEWEKALDLPNLRSAKKELDFFRSAHPKERIWILHTGREPHLEYLLLFPYLYNGDFFLGYTSIWDSAAAGHKLPDASYEKLGSGSYPVILIPYDHDRIPHKAAFFDPSWFSGLFPQRWHDIFLSRYRLKNRGEYFEEWILKT